MIPKHATLRIVRLTDHLDEIAKMYIEGLGFELLGSFDNTGDFSGRMIGHPDHAYHLVFTSHRNEKAGQAPTLENLLVFYVPDDREFELAIERISKTGFRKVKPFNPYWETSTQTFEDLDRYRVIIEHGESPF